MAELFLGRGRELNDFLYVFIGSAAGGGVVIGGDYHRGAHSNAGDLGLMPTSPSRLSTAPTPTGRREILLTRASINALIRHLRGAGKPVTTRDELDAAITAHPTLVDEWLDDCADALVDPLLAAVSVLDVEAGAPRLRDLRGRCWKAWSSGCGGSPRRPHLRRAKPRRLASAILVAKQPPLGRRSCRCTSTTAQAVIYHPTAIGSRTLVDPRCSDGAAEPRRRAELPCPVLSRT